MWIIIKKKMPYIIIALSLILIIGGSSVLLVHAHRLDEDTDTFLELISIKEAPIVVNTDTPDGVTTAPGSSDIYNPGYDILPSYRALYDINPDLTGWLSIPDTTINYPLMSKTDNETFYLYHDFYGDKSPSGCLILDEDSRVGTGDINNGYHIDGIYEKPSTNILIHGHTMKNRSMFGSLTDYADYDFACEHSTIYFDTLYEEREYEVISAFYTEVLTVDSTEFKYYNFFDAGDEASFDYWYDNIKALSLYDTGVTASYGDEFITLSCCSYHIEDGRFVVIGVRK